MSKRSSKKITRKRIYKLTSKQAEDILKQEFIDNRENKFDFRFRFKPHKPNEPTIQSTIQYEDEK